MAPSGSGAVALYRALTAAASPFLLLHLVWRRRAGLEHALHFPQRLGRASLTRPPGHLLWFHAVSVGEAMAAIPVIKHCMLMRPSLNILLTTSTVTSYFVLQQILPAGVLCQFAPIDTPDAAERFLAHWHPEAGIFMESELWPNLLTTASLRGIFLALLNARISSRSFERWRLPVARQLVMQLLSRFSLILPLSTEEAMRYQILGAPPMVVHFAGNLKYAVGTANGSSHEDAQVSHLKEALGRRSVWIAASTHPGEEDIIASIHMELRRGLPDLITIIAPRHPERGSIVALKLRQHGLQVAMRSRDENVSTTTDIYVADTIGELKLFYRVSWVAFIGGSLFKGMAGHNLAEAAAASCAVMTGPYIGHFSQMVTDFHKVSTLSIRQVSGKEELQKQLQVLFSDPSRLQACREAARHAAEICARGVINRVWSHLDLFVLQRAFGKQLDHM
eukprot:c20585_g1_i1 orf=22-1365(-)